MIKSSCWAFTASVAVFFILISASRALAAQEMAPVKDASGQVSCRVFDNHVDGKADTWIYYQKKRVVRREWDRNFDGKPDFRVICDGLRFKFKEYDNNYDGVFEKKEYPLPRGSQGKIEK